MSKIPDTRPADARKETGAEETADAVKPDSGTRLAEKSPGPGFMSSFGIATVLLVVAVVAGLATLKSWWPVVEPAVGAWIKPLLPDSDDDETRGRLATLEQRLAVLESRTNQTADADGVRERRVGRLRQDLSDVLVRVDGVERALSGLRERVAAVATGNNDEVPPLGALADRLQAIESANAANGETLAALSRTVDSLAARESAINADTARAQVVVLGIDRVRRAVVAGVPFEKPLDVLAATAPDDPAIEQAISVLRPHAAGGVATLRALHQSFSDTARAIVQADRARDESHWGNAILNKVSSLVSVRRIDGQGDPMSVDAMIAAAEERLGVGDLSGAIGLVAGLDARSSGATEAAAGWLASATARQDVDGALNTLHNLALRPLQQAPGEDEKG